MSTFERIIKKCRDNAFSEQDGIHTQAFEQFLAGLQNTINPRISRTEAIEMLSQHIITKPVFDALFEQYAFVKNNPISVLMQTMLNIFEEALIEKDTAKLQKFYDSVKTRVSGIDNAEDRQRIVIELYNKFFKTAFPKTVEKLGIVYTPVEVVDFILHSVDDVLHKEFGRTLSDENVTVIDPFTGTGTFITRLVQSGLIKKEDLPRKYEHEIFAHEIVLLAYYIAAINIENAYHDSMGGDYVPFRGICLNDTFQLNEADIKTAEGKKIVKEHAAHSEKDTPLTVIIGNPPYSAGQKSVNDNAQNQHYPRLEARIAESYVKESKATLNRAAYDSYIKAFRWASDRLDNTHGGIIGFITNSGWLDSNGLDGFRICLEKEFSTIYVFDLKGAIRGKRSEAAKREGHNIFDIMTGVAITILVKNPAIKAEKATIYYCAIGDYLKRTEKLSKLKELRSIKNLLWGQTPHHGDRLIPNEYGDWLNQRNDAFSSFIALGPEKKFDGMAEAFFTTYSLGIATSKDAWLYNFSSTNLFNNVTKMIMFYNAERKKYHQQRKNNEHYELQYDPTKITWTGIFLNDLENNIVYTINSSKSCESLYRPFIKQQFCYEKQWIQRTYQQTKIFPTPEHKNLLIGIEGTGSTKDFGCLMTDKIPDCSYAGIHSQCFPFYWYEKRTSIQGELIEQATDEYIRHDGVSDFIVEQARIRYKTQVTKNDLFYYVYGFLHSTEYRERFANDLKKMLPRLPLVEKSADFWAFSKAGYALAELHLNYEAQPHPPEVTVKGEDSAYFTVKKMRFPQKGQKNTIIYNDYITVSNIPIKAYDYIVNGKSAIEWIMERYAVTIHKESSIQNDPNDWATEHGNARYILDLLLSIITVSIKTVDIVAGLPSFG